MCQATTKPRWNQILHTLHFFPITVRGCPSVLTWSIVDPLSAEMAKGRVPERSPLQQLYTMPLQIHHGTTLKIQWLSHFFIHFRNPGFSSKDNIYIQLYIYIYTRIYMYSENCSTRILNLEADQVFSKDPLGPPKLWPTMQHVGSISGLPVFQGSLRTYKIAVDRKPTKISCRMR